MRIARYAALGGLVLGSALGGCVSRVAARGTDANEDVVVDLRLPQGAKAGMFITWVSENATADREDLRERTLACVAESAQTITIEERTTPFAGPTTVTAARFKRDGTALGAWRGPSGGAGRPVRIDTTHDDLHSLPSDLDPIREAHVAPELPELEASTTRNFEVLDTPAGRFRCTKRMDQASLPFMAASGTTWHSLDPLPLSRLVKAEFAVFGHRSAMTLRAYGYTGATPTLEIPSEATLR